MEKPTRERGETGHNNDWSGDRRVGTLRRPLELMTDTVVVRRKRMVGREEKRESTLSPLSSFTVRLVSIFHVFLFWSTNFSNYLLYYLRSNLLCVITIMIFKKMMT